MPEDESKLEPGADSGGSGNRRIKIETGASEFGPLRPWILGREALMECVLLGHNCIDEEHFLIALARYEEDVSAKALKTFGLDLVNLRDAALSIVPSVYSTPHFDVNFTPRAKRVQDDAWEEAKKLQHLFVGTEHLLLALLRKETGIVAQILDGLSVDKKELRFQLFKLMRAGND